MSHHVNPFPNDPDRAEIWDILVRRDIEAYVVGNWDMTVADFLPDEFSNISGRGLSNPDSWHIAFSNLSEYRDLWLSDSAEMRTTATNLLDDCFNATTLRDIEIKGDLALAHKKFDGEIAVNAGNPHRMNWQTLYQCRKVSGHWKITGFVGFLPHPMVVVTTTPTQAVAPAQKSAPGGGDQHATAGPYSPVLSVRADRLVVISGQAALLSDGSIDGTDIDTQARRTLQNCADQLQAASCSFADVFKVNVYMADLDDWATFNTIYQEVLPPPLPVRTTIGAKLLPGLQVEVEMWAVAT